MTTTADILALSSTDARTFIRACTDLDLLVEVLAVAEADDTEKPRRSVIAAATLRIDTLRTQQDADEQDVPVIEVEPAVNSESTVDLMVELKASLDAANGVDKAQPVKPATEDRSACAGAFITALFTGDLGLLTAMLADVRRDGLDDSGLAEAMIAEVAARQVATAPVRAPKAPRERAPRAPRVVGAGRPDIGARFEAMITAATLTDGVYVISPEVLATLDVPASWRTASLWHETYGCGAKMARKQGWIAQYSRGTLTLTQMW